MANTLENIFSSAARVKIMRLFLLNPERGFDLSEIVTRAKVSSTAARSEVAMMEKIALIKKKPFFKDKITKRGSAKKIERVRVHGWTINESFEYLEPLQRLLLDITPVRGPEIVRRLGRVGKLKLIITSGVFIRNWDSRVDLLVVGDSLKKGTLENTVKILESELGREIRYASFETADFQYRLGVYDKLIRDIIDFPHEKVLDRIGIHTAF